MRTMGDVVAWMGAVRHIRRRYREAFGRRPRLLFPRGQNERVQHAKLFERDPRLPVLADKIAVKEFVAGRIGPRYVVPTLWEGHALPPRRLRDWPRPFVLKGSHGSGWTIHVPADEPVPWGRIERRAQRWLDTTYGAHNGEWHYSRMPRRLLVEPHLGDPSTTPDDYKLFVYHGRVHYVHWIMGRGTPAYSGRLLDRDWNEALTSLTTPTAAVMPPRPDSLDTMIWMAERLAQDFTFVRVDLYNVDGTPQFGEMTFFPTGGLHIMATAEEDLLLGRLWRKPGGHLAATPVPGLEPVRHPDLRREPHR